MIRKKVTRKEYCEIGSSLMITLRERLEAQKLVNGTATCKVVNKFVIIL